MNDDGCGAVVAVVSLFKVCQSKYVNEMLADGGRRRVWQIDFFSSEFFESLVQTSVKESSLERVRELFDVYRHDHSEKNPTRSPVPLDL